MNRGEENDNVAICPVRDNILVEMALYPAVWRAVGTQYVCFHECSVPTARCLGLINLFLPISNPYGIHFQQRKRKNNVHFLHIANSDKPIKIYN